MFEALHLGCENHCPFVKCGEKDAHFALGSNDWRAHRELARCLFESSFMDCLNFSTSGLRTDGYNTVIGAKN